MKKIILLFILLFLFTSCGIATNDSENHVASVRNISATEARDIMASSDHFILLDVRTEAEFTERHIDGAMLIPSQEISARAESELPDKDMIILVYCRSGNRSAAAARTLVRMGYTNVYDFGGINDWSYGTIN
ncbi:MAG: rhodanese-like domain-containing protein [Clostridiales bacterium]|nr:rhodanese-like domain-containing protein [Clostridiales bacterium]